MRLIDSDALMRRINKNAVTEEEKLIAKTICDMVVNEQTVCSEEKTVEELCKSKVNDCKLGEDITLSFDTGHSSLYADNETYLKMNEVIVIVRQYDDNNNKINHIKISMNKKQAKVIRKAIKICIKNLDD